MNKFAKGLCIILVFIMAKVYAMESSDIGDANKLVKSANNQTLITLISSQGHEFSVPKDKALVSPTIRRILDIPMNESRCGQIRFNHIDSPALESVALLLEGASDHDFKSLLNQVKRKNKVELENLNHAIDFLELKGINHAIDFLLRDNGLLNYPKNIASTLIQDVACKFICKPLAMGFASSFINQERFLAGISDFSVVIFDRQTKETMIIKDQFGNSFYCMATDIKNIYYAGKKGIIYVWNKNSKSTINKFQAHTGSIRSIKIDGDTIISAGDDCKIRLWDKNTLVCKRELAGHDGCINCLEIDGDNVISGSYDGTIKMWDKNNGACLNTSTMDGYPSALLVQGDDILVARYDVRGSISAFSKKTFQFIGKVAENLPHIRGLASYNDILLGQTFTDGIIVCSRINSGFFSQIKLPDENFAILVSNKVIAGLPKADSAILDIERFEQFYNFLSSQLQFSDLICLSELNKAHDAKQKVFLTPGLKRLCESFLNRITEYYGDEIKEAVEASLMKLFKSEPPNWCTHV